MRFIFVPSTTTFLFSYVLFVITFRFTNSLVNDTKQYTINRRYALQNSLATTSGLAFPFLLSNPTITNAAEVDGLAVKLSKRDPAALRNSIFNIPPPTQIYPQFMRGEWDVTARFAGYIFPSKTVTKDQVTSNISIPGFQKCSIAELADIGRDSTTYRMNVSNKTGMEDRAINLASTIDAHLGYKAVENVSSTNPNRLSIEFCKNRTRNAERIELFCNARESEMVPNPNQSDLNIFVSSEYIRQVTFSLSQEFGVARQVVGNYAHFWTWRQQEGGNALTGNVLTAAYLDPQDPLFFSEPSKPVAVYSHQLTATRITI